MSSNMSEKTIEAGFDRAAELEEGRSPTASEKVLSFGPDSEPPIISNRSTFAATTKSTVSTVKRVVTGVGKAVLPNTSSNKADLKTAKLEDYPRGYPQVSFFLDSDDSFMMYRRFGRLHSRLLLHKQDQIRELEEDLYARDCLDDQDEETRAFNQCRDEADHQPTPKRGRPRQEVLQELEKLLREYGSLLEQAQRLNAMNKPTGRDHASVTRFFNNEEPVAEVDRDWLLHKDDLITIRAGRDHAWLDAAIEGLLRWYPCRWIRYIFCDKATREKTSNPNILYFTRSRITFFVTLIITMLILVLLVVPIWVLYWLSVHQNGGAGDVMIIGVLLICTLTFSCVLSLFTKAKRHELLAASAG